MKTAAALLSTLALAAASSSQAALTTHNATYDLFTVSVFETFGSAAEIVHTKESPWLITAFDAVLSDVEAQLALGEQTFPYYADRLDKFLQDAADHDDTFSKIADEYDAFDLSLPSLLGYAGRPYLDVVFETVESFLPTLKNATLSEWHMRERQAMEKRVLNGTSTGLLAGKLDEYLMTVMANLPAMKSFDAAMSSLYERAAEEYEIPSGDEDDAEEEEEEEEETSSH